MAVAQVPGYSWPWLRSGGGVGAGGAGGEFVATGDANSFEPLPGLMAGPRRVLLNVLSEDDVTLAVDPAFQTPSGNPGEAPRSPSLCCFSQSFC